MALQGSRCSCAVSGEILLEINRASRGGAEPLPGGRCRSSALSLLRRRVADARSGWQISPSSASRTRCRREFHSDLAEPADGQGSRRDVPGSASSNQDQTVVDAAGADPACHPELASSHHEAIGERRIRGFAELAKLSPSPTDAGFAEAIAARRDPPKSRFAQGLSLHPGDRGSGFDIRLQDQANPTSKRGRG